MSLGLNEQEIKKILSEKGIESGNSLKAEELKSAIADAIVKNNQKISEQVKDAIREHNNKQHK